MCLPRPRTPHGRGAARRVFVDEAEVLTCISSGLLLDLLADVLHVEEQVQWILSATD